MNTLNRIFLPVLSALVLLAGTRTAPGQLSFTLTPVHLTNFAGSPAIFSAALTNTTTSNLFLNSLQITALTSTNLTGDTNAFFFNVPGILNGSEVYTGMVFQVLVAMSTPVNDYAGTVTILGGTNMSATNVLATTNFQLTITPVPVQIISITLRTNRAVQLEMTGSPGNYIIEGATDWSGWSPLSIVTNITGAFEYIDPPTNLPQRYYRTRTP